ncbi:MAG: UTP--glucose-1-phosphate uridylyltransferase [Desulfobacteraceae bacterium]|nr:UTP--glucose-1-phosphate uridylyltransferase [Desulfobacteraceae bacterium]
MNSKIEPSEIKDHLPAFISKMESEGLPPLVIDTFAYYYGEVLKGATGLVYDRDIQPVAPDEIKSYDKLIEYGIKGVDVFDQTVRIILNGGLGTSMGLTRAKSLIEVKSGMSFLDIIIRQAENSAVTLAFMNSFSTHDDTLSALKELKPSSLPITFIQHKFPKILQQDYSPATWLQKTALEWNPPGHGDVYTALLTSGMLQSLLDKGIQYAFISNSDNLGARLDEALLGYFADNQFPFMMEVAQKTPADIKGGHLARHKNGRLILREAAQCPKDEVGAFQDIERYRFFNTNNVWINLKALKSLFDKQNMIHLPLILNPKTLDPRDNTSPPVYQVESAMGAAISLFEGATAVNVPRHRFYPVKTCSDLLAVRSDCFVYAEDESLRVNPIRIKGNKPEATKVKLDPDYYTKIDDLDQRFAAGAPSLVECDALTVEGDVRFEKNVTIKGTVSIKNRQKSQAVIKAGTVIDKDLTF